ncbi:hypothetical protein QQZ08_007620 [Neonectria magnoliae]|uniref:beta-glucosidase n=1 Tax=Neonectria magnoliae TaxID=2732573 RepID=A0ABR1HXU3_9HYPO
MARGATWDAALERRVGHAIGLEAKAQGSKLFRRRLRQPSSASGLGTHLGDIWEDPVILGEFGLALTQGVQNHVMACVIHFTLNSMENARFRVNVKIEEDVLHEVYLPHFRRIIEGGVTSVMSSYNSVNGEFLGQNWELLTNTLRNKWHFDGFVISDFIFRLRDAALSLKNGLDIDAPFTQQRALHLGDALVSGKLDWADVDKACLRILMKQLQWESRAEVVTPDMSVVFSKEHRDLAREVASRSMVLLKNEMVHEAPLLPLDPSQFSTVALVGRLANIANTGDKGSSQVFPPRVVTGFEGLKAALPNKEIVMNDTDSVETAREAAAQADVVICVVGYDANDEGEFVVPSLQSDPCLQSLFPPSTTVKDRETLGVMQAGSNESKLETGLEVGAGGDRTSLRLRPRDVEMIKGVSAANPKIVVVLVTAGAVVMEN